MGRNLDDIINGLPKDRQKKINDLSTQKVEEMIAHAKTLTDFRKAVGKTQAQVAKELGIKQNAISQLEKRSDTYVSTLRRFLKTLDLNLELAVVGKNGVRINLPNFLPWHEPEALAVNASFAPTIAKVAVQKAVASKQAKAITTKKPMPDISKQRVAVAGKSSPRLHKG